MQQAIQTNQAASTWHLVSNGYPKESGEYLVLRVDVSDGRPYPDIQEFFKKGDEVTMLDAQLMECPPDATPEERLLHCIFTDPPKRKVPEDGFYIEAVNNRFRTAKLLRITNIIAWAEIHHIQIVLPEEKQEG